MAKDVQVRVHRDFVITLNKMYPDTKSINEKTHKLNERLMELLYAKK